MSTRTNHRWLLRSRPDGIVTSDLFERDEIEVPELKDGQVLAQTLYLSFDPTPVSYTHLTLPTIYSV